MTFGVDDGSLDGLACVDAALAGRDALADAVNADVHPLFAQAQVK